MTDRILSGFHSWIKAHPPTDDAPDLTMHMGRHARPVIRHMWSAWREQAERITDMAAALDRSHKRSSELLKQCRDHDTRRAAAVAQAAALAEEVERLNATKKGREKMIAEFVELFMAGKQKIEEMFSEAHPENYKAIVEAVVTVLNNGDDYGAPDPKRIHELDEGYYQGVLVYVIAATGYQPRDYWYVKVTYGSCSGCDTLEGIRSHSKLAKPTEEQVRDYMTLALHIVQGLKKMSDDEA